MSALARFFQAAGIRVSGYDRSPTKLTREMEHAGIAIHYEDDVQLAPKDVQLVVYTPAIPADHRQLAFYRSESYQVVKRSDVLQMISSSSFNICIAGTHGKTTITTMVAHLLRHSGYGCNAFLGGISANYNTNFWSSERNCCVIEADEFDRSFLKLSPDIAIISAMDADHLDIYGTEASVEEAFIAFSNRVKPGGMLLVKQGLKRKDDLNQENLRTYSLNDASAGNYASGIRTDEGSYCFNVHIGTERIDDVWLHMGGLHNVENMVAAITVAHHLGIAHEKIKEAVAAFLGVRRRFEYIVKNSSLVYIDDYAHHPEELRALLGGVRSLFPERKCTIIFQPHLYSRTRDFATGFGKSLDLADRVILLPVYPAREQPIPGVTSELVAEKMSLSEKSTASKEAVMAWIRDAYRQEVDAGPPAVLVTAGAGDIDTLVEPIKKILQEA